MKKILVMLLMVISIPMAVIATPQPVSAACGERFLTFPTWYRGLVSGSCEINQPSDTGELQTFIWKIVLNVLEIFLQIIAYASVAFIIWGGFRYIYGAGTPDTISGARKMILNASIGLIIAMLSAGLVGFIVGGLK